MNTIPDTYPTTARVWIYMSDRELTDDESKWLGQSAAAFVQQWAAHGQDLNAMAEVRHNRFLVLMVDEEKNMASGCSIDSSVQFIREAGQKLNVDFFNRMLVAYQNEDEEIRTAAVSDLASLAAENTIQPSTKVFNNLVTTRAGLENDWITEISNSPYNRFI